LFFFCFCFGGGHRVLNPLWLRFRGGGDHFHLEAEELCCHLNDLEDHHEALTHVALDVVRVVRPKGHLLLDHLRSLRHQVRHAVAQGIRRRGEGLPGRWPRHEFGSAGI
jgi:hypothetical protein